MKKILVVLVLFPLLMLIYAGFLRKDLTLSKAYVKSQYTQPNSKFLNWNGNEIHYTDSGNGFPILMIHGFGGSNWDFKTLDSLLNDQFRVIRIDLPGFGLSDFPASENSDVDFIKVYNDYFNFLIDTLHLDSMYVMGNSLGGMMAWNLALNHPKNVKKLVLFNSAGYEMEKVIKTANARIFKYGIVKFLFRKGITKYLTKRGISRVFYDKTKLTDEKITRVNQLWNREGNLHHILTLASSKHYLNSDSIHTISCPTLIVWGKEDKIIHVKYADYFYKDIKNSQLKIYDSCGHAPMMEKPLEVKRDVLTFLKEN